MLEFERGSLSYDVSNMNPMTQPDKYLATAHVAADAAGEILREYFGAKIEAESKADSSPVTRADREVEMAVHNILRNAFPEHGIIGEEFGVVNPDSEFQWVIDPIDGTKAFIAGKPTFTTLIALCYQDIPLLGIIDQAIKRERWAAAKPFTPAPARNSQTPFRLATTSMDYFTQPQKMAFEKLRAQTSRITLNEDAYSYAMIAEGKMDVVIDAGMKPYDYLALVPIIEAAGGAISDWGSKPLTLQSQGDVVACANPALHSVILKELS